MTVLEQAQIGAAAGVSARFISSWTNRIDAKGRVSVPADYRKSLEAQGGMVCFPAFTGQVLDCGGDELLDTLMGMIANLDFFDEKREAFELSIMSESRRLSFDGDGRITLPAELRDYAQLQGQATFVGLGTRFQIWNPELHKAKIVSARKMALENRDILSARALPSLSNRKAGPKSPGGKND